MSRSIALLSVLLFAAPVSAVQGPGEDPRPGATIGAAPSFSPVTAERLVNSDAEPHNWLMYSGNYSSQRYSGLDQIHVRNVDQLQMQWAHQLRILDRSEATPLVVDGVMYVTEAPATVIAAPAVVPPSGCSIASIVRRFRRWERRPQPWTSIKS